MEDRAVSVPALRAQSNRFRQLLEVAGAVFSAHPFALAIIVLGDTVVALLQVVTLSSVYPILEQLLQSPSQSSPLSEYFRRPLQMLGLQTSVNNQVLLVLSFSVVSSAVHLAVVSFQSRFVMNLVSAIRFDLVRRVLGSQWSVLSGLNHGEFVSLVTHEADWYRSLLRNILAVVAASFQIALLAAAIIYIDAAFGFWAGLALGAGFAMFAPLMQLAGRLGKRYAEAFGGLTSALINAARAFKNVKASSLETYLLSYLRPVIVAPGDAYRSQEILEAARLRLFEFVGTGIMLGLFAFGMQATETPLAKMLLMLVFLYRLVPKVTEAADQMHRAYVALPSLARIQEMQRRCTPEAERSSPLSEHLELIAFDRVGFRHGDVPIISDVSVRFRRGEFWAICGATGAGKTTILDLIAGIIEPSSGEIRYDRHDLRDLQRPSLHQRVGYLTQETLILAGSILENIRWGHGPTRPSQLDAAIEIAQLQDVIREKTLNHTVTEAGQNLSGGQKQRIAIARVLLGDYDFILMDEPTSALDVETEIQFVKALSVLKGKVGLIMVSHRSEYLKEIDYSLTLEEGKTTIEPTSAGIRTGAEASLSVSSRNSSRDPNQFHCFNS